MPPKLSADADPVRVHVLFPPELRQRVEEWRRQQEVLPTLGDAIRQLVEKGLKARSGAEDGGGGTKRK